MVELYLITRAMHVPTRPPGHPDEYHGRTNKRQSVPSQDLTWLEAISTPDSREIDSYITRVLKDLERWEHDAYLTLERVYTGPSADIALPEKWRREVAQAAVDNKLTHKTYTKHMMLHLLEDAFVFILYRCHRDRRLLFWPTPEGARDYIETNNQKRREARYHYIREREKGTGVTQSVRLAARRGKASEQAVWVWKRDERWEANVELPVETSGCDHSMAHGIYA